MAKKFPTDALKRKVIQSLEILGFRMVREREHLAMIRKNHDGSTTPIIMLNHRRIKASTLRTICTQAGISRDEFLKAYDEV